MATDSSVLWLLVLIQFVSMGAMEMSGPFWPLHMQHLLGGGQERYVSLLSTLVYVGPMMAAMLLTPIWGRLGDRTGHKPMMLRALLALALFQGLAAVTVDPWWLVAIRVVQGVFAGFIAAAQAYALACCDGANRGRTLACLQSATAAGSLIGPVLGGWLLDVAGFALLCLGATLACVLCVVLSVLLPRDTPRVGTHKKAAQVTLPKGWIGGILLVIVLVQAAKVMPQPFYALYVANVLHAPGWLIGATYAASAATLAISAPFWGRLFDRWQPFYTLQVIEGVAWLCALTLVMSAMANGWAGFLASRLLWGIWQGALLPVAYALIASTVSLDQQGFALGLGNSAAKAGALLGAVLGGAGLGLVGLAHSFWLVALTYALAALGVRWVRRTCAAPESATLPASPPITIKEVRL